MKRRRRRGEKVTVPPPPFSLRGEAVTPAKPWADFPGARTTLPLAGPNHLRYLTTYVEYLTFAYLALLGVNGGEASIFSAALPGVVAIRLAR